MDSVEGKRNDVGMRFVLDPGVGDGGFLIWKTDVIPALIDLQSSLRSLDSSGRDQFASRVVC